MQQEIEINEQFLIIQTYEGHSLLCRRINSGINQIKSNAEVPFILNENGTHINRKL